MNRYHPFFISHVYIFILIYCQKSLPDINTIVIIIIIIMLVAHQILFKPPSIQEMFYLNNNNNNNHHHRRQPSPPIHESVSPKSISHVDNNLSVDQISRIRDLISARTGTTVDILLNFKCQSFRLRLPSHSGPAMAGQANVKRMSKAKF